MRAPLGVRINDGERDLIVSQYVSGLRFRRTASGGFHSASMRIDLPRDTFSDLGPADRIWVCDGHTARTLFEGFCDNPGSSDGAEGQAFDLAAMGSTILASDESRALVYIDQSLDKWKQLKGGASAPSASVDQSDDPTGGDAQGLLCQFNPGQPVNTGWLARAHNEVFEAAGMQVGAVHFRTKAGKIDAAYKKDIYYWTPTPPPTGVSLGDITTTQETFDRYIIDHFADGTVEVGLAIRRSGGATNVADDNTWVFFDEVIMAGRRMDRDGVLVTGAAGMVTNLYVRADWVAEDLLGRVLTMCDPDIAQIDAATFEIDQLAYHDGGKPALILDDLALWEPDFLWEILESGPAGFRFNYRAWPTTARYEISTRDGYDAPGGDVDLCNRIAVYWTDARGKKQMTQVTAAAATYPALQPLEDAGRTKDADPVTLPDGQGSAVNAQRIGEQILASKASPPVAATAVVRGKIVDMLTGATVYPWEIEPGYLVRVRETGDLLRLTETEYDDDACATTLTLGTPVLSLEQRIARLAKVTAA